MYPGILEIYCKILILLFPSHLTPLLYAGRDSAIDLKGLSHRLKIRGLFLSQFYTDFFKTFDCIL